jgi:hypothetical protein
MKRSAVLFSLLLATAASISHAQVAPAAIARQFSLTGGGTVSLFQPDYGPNKLIGIGAYVDVKFTRWIQVEGEGRWLRYNQYANIYQDNYLIGPRVPIFHFWKATPYAKALVGIGKMNFQYNYANGTFTDIAFGGGLDVNLTKHIVVRAIDVEYQDWPKWLQNQSLQPYGASVGIGYRVF